MTTEIRRLTSHAAPSTDWRRRPEPAAPTWVARTACYNRPAEWWDGDDPEGVERARRTCLSCPVLEECLSQNMRVEGQVLWARHGIRGALEGLQRTQVFLDEKESGPYDAEEARLLALEARELGLSVPEVAGEDVPAVTVRLAQRMAGETVPGVTVPKGLELRKGISLQRAWARAADIARMRQAGLSIARIAQRVHVGKTSVAEVVRAMEAAGGEAAA